MPEGKITLDHPVTIGGVEVKTLRMRRPKVKDQLASERSGGTNADKEVKLFANLCEVTPATIEELDLVDYKKIQDEYSGFLS
jgi:hypothetical protein